MYLKIHCKACCPLHGWIGSPCHAPLGAAAQVDWKKNCTHLTLRSSLRNSEHCSYRTNQDVFQNEGPHSRGSLRRCKAITESTRRHFVDSIFLTADGTPDSATVTYILLKRLFLQQELREPQRVRNLNQILTCFNTQCYTEEIHSVHSLKWDSKPNSSLIYYWHQQKAHCVWTAAVTICSLNNI